MLEQLLNDVQAAAVLGISPVTLRKDRCKHGLGVPIIRIGKSIRYSPAALQEWVQSQKQTHAITPQANKIAGEGNHKGRPTKASLMAFNKI